MLPTQGYGTGGAIATYGYGGSVGGPVVYMPEYYMLKVKFEVDSQAVT